MPDYCCDRMAAQLEFVCEQHPDPTTCPDKLVGYVPHLDEHGLLIHDGGSSHIVIRFCPWCGTDLGPSYRDAWFHRLDELGLEPEDAPPDMRTDEWWRRDRPPATLPAILAADVTAYRAQEPSATPEEASRLRTLICSTLAELLWGELKRTPAWDSTYAYLEDVVPSAFDSTDDGVTVRGGALVIDSTDSHFVIRDGTTETEGERELLVPVEAELRDQGSRSVARLAGLDAAVPYVPGGVDQLKPAARWQFEFAFELSPSATGPAPGRTIS